MPDWYKGMLHVSQVREKHAINLYMPERVELNPIYYASTK